MRDAIGTFGALTDFELSLSCSSYGTASAPAVPRSTAPTRRSAKAITPRTRALRSQAAADLAPLAALLASDDFAAFIAETSTSGSRRPGRVECTLDVESATVAVTGKWWNRDDRFAPAAARALETLNRDLAALRARLPPQTSP